MEQGQWMRREIFEQPEVVSRVLEQEESVARRLGTRLRSSKIDSAVLVGRGTSDHAAMLGQYFLEWSAGVPVALAAPSMATLYRKPLRLRNAVVLGVSQSGRSPDVVEFVRRARRSGAMTIAVTNDPSSPLASEAHDALLCRAGMERSIAATKTFTAEAAAIYLLGAHWAGGAAGERILKSLKRVPGYLKAALALESRVARIMSRHKRIDRCLVLGRGFSTPIALETALKMKEAAGIFAEGQSAADFMHGPIAMLRMGMPKRGLLAVLLAPKGPGLRSVQRATQSLARGKVRSAGLVYKKECLGRHIEEVVFRAPCPDWLAPFPWSVLGQLMAFHLAREKGLDPDHPAGLHKITRTY